jgi:hypothetical protein
MKNDTGKVTLYRKSWLFTAWMMLVLFTFPIWMLALANLLGDAGFIVGAVFWLGHGAACMLLFRCSICGLSPFLSGKGLLVWSTPWPRKTCGHCGHDHTHAA